MKHVRHESTCNMGHVRYKVHKAQEHAKEHFWNETLRAWEHVGHLIWQTKLKINRIENKFDLV